VRILVVGAGKLGAKVIRQLKKNPELEIVVADPHDDPEALRDGTVDKIDLKAHVTTMNFSEVVCKLKPDMVILARTVHDWEQSDTPMGTQYVMGMERELTKSDLVVLAVSEDVMGGH